ncbi:MAG TPA: hypothetical protein VIN08_22635 [Ohtaekwangia sp.]|uniref:hypothetical protein n=1 Tax=Ohtaekwangia sp. TaxID=2066019 RepID=UPI002F932990
MKTETRIFSAVFVREFYRQNASFFLLVVGIAGGFMRGQDHIALAESFISSPLMILIPATVWAIYTFKVINFNKEVLRRGENEFLFVFRLLPAKDQYSTLIATLNNQLMPATGYGVLLVLIALKNNRPESAAIVIVTLLLLMLFAAWQLYYSLHHPDLEKKVSGIKRWFDKTFHKPYAIFFTEWILRRQAWLLIGTKVFSTAILLAVCYLYTDEPYDHRLLGMGVVIIATAHLALLGTLHEFENYHFAVLRQLPLRFSQRVLYTSGTLLPSVILEIGLLITYFPKNLSLPILLQSILLFFAMILFIYSTLYIHNWMQKRWDRRIFILMMTLIVLILFAVPLWVLAVLLAAAGLYNWNRLYYRFEHSIDMTDIHH